MKEEPTTPLSIRANAAKVHGDILHVLRKAEERAAAQRMTNEPMTNDVLKKAEQRGAAQG